MYPECLILGWKAGKCVGYHKVASSLQLEEQVAIAITLAHAMCPNDFFPRLMVFTLVLKSPRMKSFSDCGTAEEN